MKTKSKISLILTGLILAIFMADLPAQINFYDVTGGPVLGWGNEGHWDAAVVWNPAVIKDGDTLRMWYTGHDEDISAASTKGKIGYAWSLDGITWNKYSGNPVLFGDLAWEDQKLFACAVIKDADTFKMWYGAAWWRSPTSFVVSPAKKIGYATSPDGINWTKNPLPVLDLGPASDWDNDFIVPWTVIKEENEYKMWYYAGRYGFPMDDALPRVGLATSPDGIQWTKYNDPATVAPYADSDPVLEVGSALQGDWDSHRAYEPMVMKQDTGGYLMFYTGLEAPINPSTLQQIGSARSDDGITWIKGEGNPFIKDDNSFIEWGYGIGNGTALLYDYQYHWWFSARPDPLQGGAKIGYAVSDSIVSRKEFQQDKQFLVIHNFPNPFTSSTTIEYELTVPGTVSVTIYNHLGEKIEVIEKKQSQGMRKVVWIAKGLPAGIYFCVLKTDQGIRTTKMIKLN